MNTRIETRFTRDYGVEHPVALAPMAFVGTPPNLAIAICKAGGTRGRWLSDRSLQRPSEV